LIVKIQLMHRILSKSVVRVRASSLCIALPYFRVGGYIPKKLHATNANSYTNRCKEWKHLLQEPIFLVMKQDKKILAYIHISSSKNPKTSLFIMSWRTLISIIFLWLYPEHNGNKTVEERTSGLIHREGAMLELQERRRNREIPFSRKIKFREKWRKGEYEREVIDIERICSG